MSQGKFDEFLRAPKADRYKLLEIITGTVLFREIGKMAFERHREVKEKIRLLTDTMGAIEVFSEADLAAIETKKQALESEHNDGEQLLTTLRNKIKTKQDIASLHNTLTLLGEEKEKLAKEETVLAGAMERLLDVEKTAPLIKQWNALQSMQKDLSDEQKAIEEASSSLMSLLDERSGVINSFSSASGKTTDEHGFIAALDAFFNLLDGMDKSIATLETEVSTIRVSLANFINTLPEKTRTILKPISADTAQLKNYVMGQQEVLRKNILPDAFKQGNFQDAITVHQNRITELSNCLTIAALVQNNEDDKKRNNEEVVDLTNQINALNTSVRALDTTIDDELVDAEEV